MTRTLAWSYNCLSSGGRSKSSPLIFSGSNWYIHLQTLIACWSMYIFLFCLVFWFSKPPVLLELIVEFPPSFIDELSPPLEAPQETFICSIMRTIKWLTCLCSMSIPFIAYSVSALLLLISPSFSSSILSTFFTSRPLSSYTSKPIPLPGLLIPPVF